jgi:hypothetical protein
MSNIVGSMSPVGSVTVTVTLSLKVLPPISVTVRT